MKIIYFDELSSTNDEIEKYSAAEETVAVVAAHQTAGRGTKGRSFSSERGGAYVSFVKKFNEVTADRAYEITEELSLAVVFTLAAFGVSAGIKWPNDIFVNGKKICGMLIKNKIENGRVTETVCGLGVNVNNPLPEELKEIAVSLKDVLGKEIDLSAFIATLLFNVDRTFDVRLYKKYSLVIGRQVLVKEPSGAEYFAVAEEILSDGRLLVEGGKKLSVAEIRL